MSLISRLRRWPSPLLLIISLVACGPSVSAGEPPPAAVSKPPRFARSVRSPEVTADRRVIFRFRAPNAITINVMIDDQPPRPMTRHSDGNWSLTTDPLPPDIYAYTFIIDGVEIADPGNPLTNPKVMGGHSCFVHVPGSAPALWDPADAPRGTVHRHRYRSAIVGEDREYWVYTPPGYDPSESKSYPVLYLLHGVTDDAEAWLAGGRADVILDNLIAAEKVRPMLLVMPEGYGFQNPADRVGELFQFGTDHRKLIDVFAATLLDEVIPQVEKAYRARANRESRALAGLSMGGAQALYVGLKHAEEFGCIGSFSGAFIMVGGQFDRWLPELHPAEAPPLVWLSCGDADFVLGSNRFCRDWLTSKQIKFDYRETEGSHNWRVWRRDLADFAGLIFRKSDRSGD